MNATSIKGELHDGSMGGRLPVEVELHPSGVWVRLDGYGQAESVDGDGWCVRIEFWNGKPQVVVWSDIKSCDPTIIDLTGAAERLRRE